ncbi:MAG: MarR family winged helix-turn-helix transcriptional regulator [Bacteroidota bacterium]
MASFQKPISTPHLDRINPRQCINSRLRKMHRMINQVYMARIKPFGLRGSMLSIIFIIGKNPGVNQKTLAERLLLDPSTMSRDLQKLVKKGWVYMEKGQDGRHSALYMTREGYELLEEVSPVWEETHRQFSEILGSFSLMQIDQITAAIQQSLPQIDD